MTACAVRQCGFTVLQRQLDSSLTQQSPANVHHAMLVSAAWQCMTARRGQSLTSYSTSSDTAFALDHQLAAVCTLVNLHHSSLSELQKQNNTDE